MNTQVAVDEARVKLVKPDSPEFTMYYLVSEGYHVPIAKKCVEEAVRRSNMHDDLIDTCADMASILNGLHLGTMIDNSDKVDHIRKVEENARTLISKSKNNNGNKDGS